jgi:superfamily II DNA or RNA helicase
MFQLRPHQQQMLNAMSIHNKGIITCPTGGGKTFVFVNDCRRFLGSTNVVVIVAPQLLLSQQLFNEFDKHLSDIDFIYRQISSEGKTYQRDRKNLKFRVSVNPQSPTTVVKDIQDTYRIAQKVKKPLILFSTYDSLNRIVSSGIPIEAVYYDEAHNSTGNEVFNAVKSLSAHSKHNYFFTATLKNTNSRSVQASGMDNNSVYGNLICNVLFGELIKAGVIVRPFIHLLKSTANTDTMSEVSVNMHTIKEVVEHYETEHSGNNHKILFCTQGTKSINDLINGGLLEWANAKGYKVLSIDSENGGFVNGETKVSKSKFIQTLNELGEDLNEKLIVLHYSMLGEGIDIKAFTGVVFLRQSMSSIFTTQSMGRVIRAFPGKKYGIVTIVQHENYTNENSELMYKIINDLIVNGVPVAEIFTEVSGRGMKTEEVENLNSGLKKRISDYSLNFEHTNILQELLKVENPLDIF